MVKEWPRQQAQIKAAIKKERPLEEKVLGDVRKKVSQIQKMLKPALENSTLSNTTKEAEQAAHAVAKVCVCCCDRSGSWSPEEALCTIPLVTIKFVCEQIIYPIKSLHI